MIESPCIKVCVMNDATGLCRGCHRTLEEIARWSQMSDEERREVIEAIARRKPGAPQDAGSRPMPAT
ncbi:MAG TPA: DUF1289 domain-containing protein [Burkholderiales bacterium]|nr:DUF1289 domain-containing protein [Burkholderiales bacterium]